MLNWNLIGKICIFDLVDRCDTVIADSRLFHTEKKQNKIKANQIVHRFHLIGQINFNVLFLNAVRVCVCVWPRNFWCNFITWIQHSHVPCPNSPTCILICVFSTFCSMESIPCVWKQFYLFWVGFFLLLLLYGSRTFNHLILNVMLII